MAFTKDNAAIYGSRGGKNKAKPPEESRNIKISLAVRQEELTRIDAKANRLNLSRTELIVRAVDAYRE